MNATEIKQVIDSVSELIKAVTSPQLVVLYALLAFKRTVTKLLTGLRGKDWIFYAGKYQLAIKDAIREITDQTSNPEQLKNVVDDLLPQMLDVQKSDADDEVDSGNRLLPQTIESSSTTDDIGDDPVSSDDQQHWKEALDGIMSLETEDGSGGP